MRGCVGVVIGATAIGLQQYRDLAAAQRSERAIEQRRDVGRLPIAVADIVTLGMQQPQDLEGALCRVETDRIAGTSAARGVIRHYERQSALRGRLATKICPSR